MRKHNIIKTTSAVDGKSLNILDQRDVLEWNAGYEEPMMFPEWPLTELDGKHFVIGVFGNLGISLN